MKDKTYKTHAERIDKWPELSGAAIENCMRFASIVVLHRCLDWRHYQLFNLGMDQWNQILLSIGQVCQQKRITAAKHYGFVGEVAFIYQTDRWWVESWRWMMNSCQSTYCRFCVMLIAFSVSYLKYECFECAQNWIKIWLISCHRRRQEEGIN